MSNQSAYTVIGYWDYDAPIAVGVVPGEHPVGGGEGCSEGGPWAITVLADSMDDAEVRAVTEMEETADERDNDDD